MNSKCKRTWFMTFLSLFYVWRYVYLCMRIYTRIGVRFMRSVCLLRWQLTSWAMSGRYVVYRWWCTQVRCGVCVWMVYLSMTLSNGGIWGTITGWIKFLKGHGFRHQTTISILSSLPSQTVTWFTHFFLFFLRRATLSVSLVATTSKVSQWSKVFSPMAVSSCS